MGYIIMPKCDCIKTTEKFHIGLGIKDFDRKRQNELSYCNGCGKFKLMKESDECECGGRLKSIFGMDMIEKDIYDIECPRCGGRLQIEIQGLWD